MKKSIIVSIGGDLGKDDRKPILDKVVSQFNEKVWDVLDDSRTIKTIELIVKADFEANLRVADLDEGRIRGHGPKN